MSNRAKLCKGYVEVFLFKSVNHVVNYKIPDKCKNVSGKSSRLDFSSLFISVNCVSNIRWVILQFFKTHETFGP